jgi:hypothetical protein
MAHAIPSIVYVRAAIEDSVDPGVGSTLDLFAQSVAAQFRLMLHSRGDTLPSGEPAITWRGIEPHIALGVTSRRRGGTAYQLLTPHRDSVAAEMLLAAAHAADDAGDGVLWMSDMPGDSVTSGLSFVLSEPGTAQLPDSGRAAFPVFSVMRPPETPVRATSKSFPSYPNPARMRGANGVLVVEFLVDSTGRVTPGTVKEVWDPKWQRPKGELLTYYNQFLRSVLDWVPRATFEPARVGGCPVPQLVQEPFTFTIAR